MKEELKQFVNINVVWSDPTVLLLGAQCFPFISYRMALLMFYNGGYVRWEIFVPMEFHTTMSVIDVQRAFPRR